MQDSYPGFRPACGAAFSVDVNDEERLIVVQEVERTHLRHLDARAAQGDSRSGGQRTWNSGLPGRLD